MNKKTFFLIGGISTVAVAIPFIAATSCSSTNSTKYLGILPKSVITLSIIEKEISTNPISKQTLNKVFDGITNETFDQVNSAWDPVTKTITLTAKPGYKFGTEKESQDTVVSQEINLATALDITVNPKMNENIFILGEVEWPGNLSKETLDKAFTGITLGNMTHFDSTAELTENNNCRIILTAKPGYGFDSENGSEMISSVFPVKKDNEAEIGRTLKIANNDTYKNQVKEMIFGKDKPITKEAINNFLQFTPEENQLIDEFKVFIKGKVSITKEELKQFYMNPWLFNSSSQPDYYISADDTILFNDFFAKKVNDVIDSNPKFKGIFKKHLLFTSMLIKNPVNPTEIMGRTAIYLEGGTMNFFDQATINLLIDPLNWKEAPKLTKKQILIHNQEERLKMERIIQQKRTPFVPSSKHELAEMVLGIMPRSGEYFFMDILGPDNFTMFPSIAMGRGYNKRLPNIVEFKNPANPVVEFAFSGKIYHTIQLSKVKTILDLIEKTSNLEISIWQITLNDDGTNKVLTPEEQKEVDRLTAEMKLVAEESKKFIRDPNNVISNVGINSITDGPILIGIINHFTIAVSSAGTVLPAGTILTNTSTSEEVFEAIKNNITIDGKAPTTSPGDVVWKATIDLTGEIAVKYTSKDSVFIGSYPEITFTIAKTPTTP
ncbi:MAG: hypothetical protein ACRDAW_02435 [Metamycoplasmataceae bacterium]